MKNFIFIFCIVAASCCSTKTKTATPTEDIAVSTDNPIAADTVIAVPTPSGNEQTSTAETSNSTVPGCIKKMIEEFRKTNVENPPRKIYSFNYQGKTVYYVTPPCCDFYSDLYDSNCNLIGHPDGGITGKGDGKMPDFHSTKSGEKLVWQDKRGSKTKN